MEYVSLGKLKVSKLCFGSLTIGPLQCNLSVRKGAEIIARAFELGVNFIDTAQYYKNYEYIRAGMELSGNKDTVISSKTYAYDRAAAMSAVEEARAALNRDYIDIFMLHEQESIHTLRGHSEALDYLFEAREKGLIRAVGVSMHHIAAVEGVCELIRRGYPIDCVHPICNLTGLGIADGNRDDMLKAIASAHKLGAGVFSMKPLGGGHLYNDAAKAFDFLLDCEAVDAIAVGMQSVEEVEANVHFFKYRNFGNAEIKRKRALFIEDHCEKCGKCIERCSQKALVRESERIRILHGKCVLCGYCSAVCPVFAIKVL